MARLFLALDDARVAVEWTDAAVVVIEQSHDDDTLRYVLELRVLWFVELASGVDFIRRKHGRPLSIDRFGTVDHCG